MPAVPRDPTGTFVPVAGAAGDTGAMLGFKGCVTSTEPIPEAGEGGVGAKFCAANRILSSAALAPSSAS